MSECSKLDGYAIENFGVWVEDEVVGSLISKWGIGVLGLKSRPQSDLRGRSRPWLQIPLLSHLSDLVFCAERSEPPSTASEAVSWYVLFRCLKIIEGSIFRGLDKNYNLLSDLRSFEAATSIFGLGGYPRPKIANIVILLSLKDDNFFILQDLHLRPFEATTSSDLRGRLRPWPQIDL